MKLAIQLQEGDVTLKVSEESKIYSLNYEELFNQAISLIKGETETLRLDLGGIKFIDSTAFNSIVKLHKMAHSLEKRLIVINVTEHALRLFEILRLNEVLTIQTENGEITSTTAA